MDDRVWDTIEALSDGEGAAFALEACRALVENTRDVILLVRPDGRVVLANAAAERSYGWSRTELAGMNITDLRAESTRDVVPVQIDTAIDTGILFETVHVRRDGSEFPVEVSSRGVAIGGRPHAISVIRDISARRKRERELVDLLAELESANRQLSGLLKIVSSAVGRFDTQGMLDDVLSVLREVMGADGALLLVLDRDRWRIRSRSGLRRLNAAEFSMPADEGFASMLAATGQALWVRNVSDTEGFAAIHGELGIRSMLGVPLRLDGELFGVLECIWLTEQAEDEAQRLTLQVAADRITSAIAGAERFEGARRARDLEAALADAAASLTSSHVLAEMVPEALGVMASALGCDGAAFGSYRDGGFEVEYGIGVDPGPVGIPDHSERIASQAASPPVVRLGADAHDAGWVRDVWGWSEALVTPVRVRGEWVGALLFGRSKVRGGFGPSAEGAMRRLSTVFSLAYANARDFEAEHRIAETLQESLLRLDTAAVGVELAHVYRSATVATRVGGDFYDVFEMPDGLVGILIGDVSGKGLDAAVLTTLVKHTLRAFAHESTSPSAIVERANDVLAGSARLRDFASVLLVVIDPKTGACRYCRAGHPPGLIARADGGVDATECGSPVIGALPELEFEECALELAQGDVLVLYTDGVTEARDASGSFFGEERLVDVVRGAAGGSPDFVVGAVDAAVRDFSGGRLSDDVAIVAVRLS